jgi:ABC-2 type transport system permease protein
MMKPLYRVAAFIIRELQSILVQPELLLLLIVGPFLVLLVFGLGYKPAGPDLRTVIVQSPLQDPSQSIGLYLSAIGPPLRVVQVTPDMGAALRQLQARQVDLVVVVPPGIRETLLHGQNVHLVYYHNELDPAQVGYIAAVIDGATNQLNRAILRMAIGQQQSSSADYELVLRQLQTDLTSLRQALRQNDRARALLLTEAVRLDAGLVSSLWLFSAQPFSDQTAPAVSLSDQAHQLESTIVTPGSDLQALDPRVGKMQEDVARLLTDLQRSRQIPPDVIVSPLAYDVKQVSTYSPNYVAYHSPSVMALLVQHLCITLAALSLVDERNAGAIEIFRASPAGPGQVLAGKFLAYVLVVALAALALAGLLFFVLSVPLFGGWRWFIVVVAALMAHSLALGFTISAIARSRSQAIQMSMLALLASIFFSGFFIPLADFAKPVRVISYSLPVTYGIELLRRIVLRGEPPDPLFLGALIAWAIVLGFVAVRIFRRQFVAR